MLALDEKMPEISLPPRQPRVGEGDILSFLYSCRIYTLRAKLYLGVMLLALVSLYTRNLGPVPKERANVKGK